MGAAESSIAESVHFARGETKTPYYDVTSDGTTPQAMTGWALSWTLYETKGGAVIFAKTTGAAEIAIGNGAGTDDRATVSLSATDTGTTITKAGTYYAELWRTDVGALQLLSFGDVVIR